MYGTLKNPHCKMAISTEYNRSKFVAFTGLDFLSHSRIFHSFGDVTIAANVYLCSALIAID